MRLLTRLSFCGLSDFRKEGDEAVQCRFCWCTEDSEDNPLILACKCAGSVGYIHYMCLKNWIKTQRHVKEYGENVTSYYWKKFECEICKQSYPYIFKKGQTLFKLIDINEPKPGSQYILLESMPLDKNTSRNIHMLTVTDKKSDFKLGRGHESEVRINDISVSRCHAIIKCRKDGFYIEDNLSKFGTIVLLKNTLRLAEDHTMAVQVGRSVVSFTIKNIDVDRKMREKLKREIAPLLSKNKNQNLSTAANANGAHNQPLKSSNGGAGANLSANNANSNSNAPSGGAVPADNALVSNNGPPDGQAVSLAVTSAERPTGPAIRGDREVAGAYSASREGKRLNMLGFSNPAHHHLLDGSSNAAASSIVPNSTNEREHRDLSGLMGAYGSVHHGAGQPGYGSGQGAGAATASGGRGEGILSQSGVSHSALVNSGNAAILGHNSFKLGSTSNTNNLNAANAGVGGPATLGSTYGALGASSGLHHH